MSSYRRHATHKNAAERALRQVLRHRMETYAEPFPDGSMHIGAEALVRGVESLRASLEKWPVPPPSDHDVAGCTGAWDQYRSGRRKCSDCGEEMNSVRCLVKGGHLVMMDGHCALCSHVDPAPEPRVVGYRRTVNSSLLRCLDHPPHESMSKNYIPVTSGDLENGGMCALCGNDLLAHPGANQ